MKRTITTATIAIAFLSLAGCTSNAPETAPETVTETVATSSSSSMTQEDLHKKMNEITGVGSASEENMTRECQFALADEVPGMGSMNFDADPIEWESFGGKDGAEVFGTNGTFDYQDATDAWVTGHYHCQIVTRDGQIEDVSAMVM